uniref:Uncharacterized protein n=1 Tax=Cacopsylla melanoneura TaxID=428564 RepID=A0A8D9FFI3_9HEMI
MNGFGALNYSDCSHHNFVRSGRSINCYFFDSLVNVIQCQLKLMFIRWNICFIYITNLVIWNFVQAFEMLFNIRHFRFHLNSLFSIHYSSSNFLSLICILPLCQVIFVFIT